MLESRQLRYFLAVAEHLHFGRAADALGVAQSALSRHIKAFERELGVRLLNRGRRSLVSLTEPGEAFLADARVGIRQLERAEAAAHRAARGEIGRLAVGYVASAALSGVLPLALERFRVKFPTVEVEVSAMETPTQLEALRDGLIDVGFLRPRTEYPPGIRASVVHRESMLIALAANHALAAKRIELKHLADQNFIIPQFDENTGFAEHLAQLAAQGGFAPKKILRVRDFLTAITLAAGGYGVVPAPKCVSAIAMRNLIFKPVQGGTPAELVVAYREPRASTALTAFVKEALRGARSQGTA
jgi:LysR family transcriptional regulator, benzoate and cis,cis-muconate-responsive activator of ben and cat genes